MLAGAPGLREPQAGGHVSRSRHSAGSRVAEAEIERLLRETDSEIRFYHPAPFERAEPLDHAYWSTPAYMDEAYSVAVVKVS